MGWLRAKDPAGLRLLATGRRDKPYQFRQDGGGYDRNVRHARALREIFTYIHNNPVARGLVSRPEDWPWSSARDWAGLGPGSPPRTAMAAMRHSRIELTMNLYTDPTLLDVTGAVEALPDFQTVGRERQKAAM